MQKTNSSLEPPGLRWSWEVPTPRRGSAAPFPSQLLNRDPLGALDPTSRRHPHAARQAGAAAALAKASRRRDHAGGQRDARLARPTDARNLALPRVPECRDCARAAPSLAWWRGEAGPSGGGGGAEIHDWLSWPTRAALLRPAPGRLGTVRARGREPPRASGARRAELLNGRLFSRRGRFLCAASPPYCFLALPSFPASWVLCVWEGRLRMLALIWPASVSSPRSPQQRPFFTLHGTQRRGAGCVKFTACKLRRRDHKRAALA